MENEDHRHIWTAWQEAFLARDADALSSLYAEDGVLEGPIIPMVMNQDTGVLRGRDQIAAFIHKSFKQMASATPSPGQTPPKTLWRPDYFFSFGETLVWEHPRLSPNGEQIDVVQVVDVDAGLINYHRTYWGWRSMKPFLSSKPT